MEDEEKPHVREVGEADQCRVAHDGRVKNDLLFGVEYEGDDGGGAEFGDGGREGRRWRVRETKTPDMFVMLNPLASMSFKREQVIATVAF